MNDDINVLALVKGKERYIFLYDDSQRAETLRMLGRHASNPELSFTWYDAVTSDALFFVPEPPLTGQGTQLRNVGEITKRTTVSAIR